MQNIYLWKKNLKTIILLFSKRKSPYLLNNCRILNIKLETWKFNRSIIIILLLWEFFTPVLADVFLREFE